MELLVAVLHAHQDGDGLLLARRLDLDGLEAALERAVLLDVLAVLGRRGRADAADLAAAERRLEDVGGIERALRRPGPDQGVQLVDEHDDVRVLGQLLHDRLEALFELAAVLGAGDDEGDVEGEQALVGQEVRHVAADDLLGQTFDDRGLADPRFTDQHGVVLGAPAQHLLHPLQLVVAADQRVEVVLHRDVGQVAAELGQERRLLDPGQRGLLVQQLDDVLAHRVEAHPLFHQDAGRDRALLAEQAEQQVLGPDVVVEETVGLLGGVLEDPLGLAAEGDLDRGRDLLAEDGPALDVLADAVQRQVGTLEDPAGQTLPFPDQPEQQVLGFNRNAAELTGLIAGEEQNPPCSFGVPLEHPAAFARGDEESRRSLGSIIRDSGRPSHR